MKKHPVLGIFLMIFALIFSLLGIVAGAISIVTSIFTVVGQFAVDESVNAYYSFVEPYINMVNGLPLVSDIVNTVNGVPNSGWIVLVITLVLIVATFVLGGIGKLLGGKVINIFANLFNALGIIVFLAAVVVFFISINYPTARDIVMSIIVKTKGATA